MGPPFLLHRSPSACQRSFRSLAGQRSQRFGEMLPIMEEKDSARAALHQERHQRRVGLGCVAVPAGQDQVVRTVICRLSPPGTDMVERNGFLAGLRTAVCADGAM